MEFENWLPYAAGIFLLGMVLYGHYRGFLKQCLSIGTLILTLMVVKLATPYITGFLNQNPQVRQAVVETVSQSIGLDEIPAESNIPPSYQRIAIENLNLPDFVKEGLIENNNSEIYNLLGVDDFVAYVSSYLAEIIINAACTVLLFILTFIVIQILVHWLNLISRLPIIHGLDQLAGAALGLIHGLLLLWVGFLILDVCSATELGANLLSQIDDSLWLSVLKEYNLLNFILIGIRSSIF